MLETPRFNSLHKCLVPLNDWTVEVILVTNCFHAGQFSLYLRQTYGCPYNMLSRFCTVILAVILHDDDDDDDEIAYFTVRWKTRASFVYRTKNMR